MSQLDAFFGFRVLLFIFIFYCFGNDCVAEAFFLTALLTGALTRHIRVLKPKKEKT